jgi:hypothetical protein
MPIFVISAKAGIQGYQSVINRLDSGFPWDDELNKTFNVTQF